MTAVILNVRSVDRMGGAERYPLIAFCEGDGFRGRAPPILRAALPLDQG